MALASHTALQAGCVASSTPSSMSAVHPLEWRRIAGEDQRAQRSVDGGVGHRAVRAHGLVDGLDAEPRPESAPVPARATLRISGTHRPQRAVRVRLRQEIEGVQSPEAGVAASASRQQEGATGVTTSPREKREVLRPTRSLGPGVSATRQSSSGARSVRVPSSPAPLPLWAGID